MVRPGRRARHEAPTPSDWVPAPLPRSAGLFAPVLAHTFTELGVSASLWVSGDWWHPLCETQNVTLFEYEYGVAASRHEYNRKCLSRAIEERRPLLGQHAGFRDLFVPVEDARSVPAVLVVGPFAVERPTAADVLQRWHDLTGFQGRVS
ncbi:MAG TPA: hypothetical protein VGP93_15080, partial [Polyangiaceae bacterium]|nr:hypothetical protein [Polyangiaceae bacterium]